MTLIWNVLSFVFLACAVTALTKTVGKLITCLMYYNIALIYMYRYNYVHVLVHKRMDAFILTCTSVVCKLNVWNTVINMYVHIMDIHTCASTRTLYMYTYMWPHMHVIGVQCFKIFTDSHVHVRNVQKKF